MAPLAKSVKKELVHSDLYVFCLTCLFPGTHPKAGLVIQGCQMLAPMGNVMPTQLGCFVLWPFIKFLER